MQLMDDSVRRKHPTQRADASSGLETMETAGVLKVPTLAGRLLVSGGGSRASPPVLPWVLGGACSS